MGVYIEHLLEQDDDETTGRDEVIAAVRESLADVAAGRVRPLQEALEDIAKKHGLKIDS